MNQEFQTPPKITNPSGDERAAGFEFEFTGVEMDEVASVISELYGGNIRKISTFEFEISGTDHGDYRLELDAQMIREKKYEAFLTNIGINLSEYENQEVFEDSLKDLASSVVPYEIITPPLLLSSIKNLTKLVDELRHRKAKGTGSSFVYAFGMHINPEIPDDSPKSILNHIRAFILLDSWIRQDAAVDFSRRLTPFIKRFEDAYSLHVLNPKYNPNLEELITDYFTFGNTRNRPLDMQPLFMYLAEDVTSGFVQDSLTSARPTYHYRLPNCSLEDPGWSLADEWNRWVLIETLAEEKKALKRYSKAFLRLKTKTMVRFETKWLELIDQWVKDVR